ncbi:MAG TPA: hypothetical protein VMV04_18235 [Thermodesulfobacteriota bacterium]|nr:hypothetical protein [Thermodesulfobacteriota bacterium]
MCLIVRWILSTASYRGAPAGRAAFALPVFHSPSKGLMLAHRPLPKATEVRSYRDGVHPTLIVCGRKTPCVVREAVMQVRVKLYASLSRHYGKAAGVPFEINLPESASIVDLVNRLKLPKEEVKVFFVRGRARPIDWPLEQGDEVGIFPLLGGG